MSGIPQIRYTIQAGRVYNEPDHVSTIDRHVSPGISERIITLTDSLVKDYVYRLGKNFSNIAHARITFSVEKGIVFGPCSDTILPILYFQNAQSFIPLPSEVVASHVYQAVPTPKMLRQTPPNHVFVDIAALSLHKSGLEAPVTIDLEIVPSTQEKKNAPLPSTEEKKSAPLLMSANLRFPHLLLALLERLDQGRHPRNSSVCIIDPGVLEYEISGLFETCPQLAESLAVFPEGKFTVLSGDKRTIRQIEEQAEMGLTTYDPAALRLYTDRKGEFVKDPKYQNLFARLKENLGRLAVAPSHTKEMLAGIGEAEPLFLRVLPRQLELRGFEITSPSFNSGEKFDIIVAVGTTVDPSEAKKKINPPSSKLLQLAKLIDALKIGGTIYLDLMMSYFFLDAEDQREYDSKMRQLEIIVGNRLEIERIPFSSFQQEAVKPIETITFVTTNEIKGIQGNQAKVRTSNLWTITRMGKKVNTARRNEIDERLIAKHLVDAGEGTVLHSGVNRNDLLGSGSFHRLQNFVEAV